MIPGEQVSNYTLRQIQQQVPSIRIFGFNPRNTNIRGLGSNVATTNDGLKAGVRVYVDDVHYAAGADPARSDRPRPD